ncbi:alpha/beta fold hydrolase, partial [Streptomyces carpinensis]
MGGQTSLRLATEHPDRISHLITMGPPVGRMPTLFGAGDGPSEGLKVLIEAYRDASPENMRRLVEIMVYDKARFATPELCQARSRAALARPDHLRNYVDGLPKGVPLPTWVRPELLPQIQVPTLLIHGRDDRVVPFENSLYLLANIPDSRLVLLNHCGHWAM